MSVKIVYLFALLLKKIRKKIYINLYNVSYESTAKHFMMDVVKILHFNYLKSLSKSDTVSAPMKIVF